MDQRINIAGIMLPKVSTVYINDTDTVRQGMEVFRRYGYTAIPVVSQDGRYLGSVTEGDFLRHVCNVGSTDLREMEKYRISDIFRPDFCPALPIDANIDEVVSVALKQNFIPIVDSRGCLSGMVTRQSLIRCLAGLTI